MSDILYDYILEEERDWRDVEELYFDDGYEDYLKLCDGEEYRLWH